LKIAQICISSTSGNTIASPSGLGIHA